MDTVRRLFTAGIAPSTARAYVVGSTASETFAIIAVLPLRQCLRNYGSLRDIPGKSQVGLHHNQVLLLGGLSSADCGRSGQYTGFPTTS